MKYSSALLVFGLLPLLGGSVFADPVASENVPAVQAAVSTPAVAGPAKARSHETQIDGSLVFALPAALPTGLSTGIGAGVLRGKTFAWGARASWSGATEFTSSWRVHHSDIRARLIGALQHAIGSGTIALRVGLGSTAVHESRKRSQGEQAGLTGDELENSSWALLPAGDLELAVTLRLSGRWGMVVSGGPSLHVLDGDVRSGWLTSVGVAWQP